MGRDADISVRQFKGRDAVHALAPSWDVVAGRSTPYFAQSRWYRQYVDHLDPRPEDLRFFALYRGETPIGIVPLREARRSLRGLVLRVLEMPWHPETPITDIVAAPGSMGPETVRPFRSALHDAGLKWDAMVFRWVTDTSAAMAWTRNWARRQAIPATTRHFIRCDRPYSELSASWSKNFRANLRKAKNKLEAMEGVNIVLADDSATLPGALRRFLEVEGSGWKGRGGSAIAGDPQRVAFYEGLVEDFGTSHQCVIFLLEVQGRTIAGQFCLISGRTVHLLKCGYDEDFSRVSPSHMLLDSLVERCVQRSEIEIDLVTDAGWHLHWNPGAQPVFEVMIFNRTLPGVMAHTLLGARKRLESWRTGAT